MQKKRNQNKRKNYFVFVIPIACELDMNAAGAEYAELTIERSLKLTN